MSQFVPKTKNFLVNLVVHEYSKKFLNDKLNWNYLFNVQNSRCVSIFLLMHYSVLFCRVHTENSNKKKYTLKCPIMHLLNQKYKVGMLTTSHA